MSILFQTVFCATAATIVSGAMAERTKFSSYIIYSAVISMIIYPIAVHWLWGGGWLSTLSIAGTEGMIDFAGLTLVHSVGGWSALVGAAILGPRIGKYRKDGKPNAIPGHNIVIGALAGFVVVFGVEFVDKKLKVDDPVGAMTVHGFCGALGTLMVGFFSTYTGLLFGGGIGQLAIQSTGILAYAAWTFGTTFGLFKFIKAATGLRVSREEEVAGLDMGEHGTDCYADFVLKM